MSFDETTNRPPVQDDDEIENESVSEAGDIGDRALHSNRCSGSFKFSFCCENGSVALIPEDDLLQSYGFWSRRRTATNTVSPVSPSTLEIISQPVTDASTATGDRKQNEEEVPWLLVYISCLMHLAVFGILGVLTRYSLGRLFGPGVADATNDESYMYTDLPSNMVGSFLMGWLGVVFKEDIANKVSDQLAIGLSTGYLGSLTTFSGWNQKMLDLTVNGHWVFGVLGFLLGFFLVHYSIISGIDGAKRFKQHLEGSTTASKDNISNSKSKWKVNNKKRHFAVLVLLTMLLCLLYGLFAALEKRDFRNGGSEAQLWLACTVAPGGVWIRWLLARLNGRGLGKAGSLKWIPFGTLIANVSAACVMAALATVKKEVNTKNCNTVATGIQFGVMGCLSTVSTFIAEYHAMRQSKHPWKADAYALITIAISFAMGTLIYSVPFWTKGYIYNP